MMLFAKQRGHLLFTALVLSFASSALVTLAVSPSASAASSVPLPSDTKIVTPAADVAPEIAAFSGKWVGIWDDTLEHMLVVEQINPPNAVVIYASGEAPSWGISKASFGRPDARIEACTLTLTLKRPATVTYRMQKDGTLDATYEWSGVPAHAVLKRVDEGTATAPKAATVDCPAMPAAFQAFLDARPRVDKLPTHLKGWYRFTSSVDFKEYSQTTEFEIASQEDDGTVTGFFSMARPRWGSSPDAMCFGADKLPMTARYDGQKITLSIKGSQNGPGCRDYTRMFERGKDHYFERKANDNSWYWYYDAAE